MRQSSLLGLAACVVLVVAACSSSGSTAPPPVVASAAPSVEASPAATVEASAAASASVAAGGAACSESATAGQVAVTIKDFAFGPAAIAAKVGNTVTFTNGDSAPHTATVDDGSCTTGTISPGSSDGLTFTAAGTYPFHCKIHTKMKGTITVS